MCSQQACNNAVRSKSCYNLVSINLLTTCWVQSGNRLLEQLVISLLKSSTLLQVVNNLQQLVTDMLTDWKQPVRTHRGDSLLNSIVTTCLQACNSLRVFTCVVVNILVFDLRVQLQHCMYQRKTLLSALIKVSTFICKGKFQTSVPL